MKSFTSPSFRKLFARLPNDVRDQVAIALDVQPLQDLAMVRPGLNVEEDDVAGRLLARPCHSPIEAVAVKGRVIQLKVGVRPIGLEGGAELFDDGLRIDHRQADVPFRTVDECRLCQVGGADVGGGEAAVAMEEPGLGVKAGVVGGVLRKGVGLKRDVRRVAGLMRLWPSKREVRTDGSVCAT